LTEWWYFTGHLRSAGGRSYGFEFTIFQVLRQDAPSGYLAHYAISDIDGQRFSHAAHASQTAEPQPGFPLRVEDWVLDQQGSTNTIDASMPGYELHVQLSDEKPPALHHGGYIEYGPAGGSYYYSRTRLSVSGHVNTESVSGIAWMDHQWGNFVVTGQGGWDWYSLQLDDRTELMLYVLRDGSGATSGVYGSFIAADGSVRELTRGEVQAEATGQWLSPHTGATYPSGWRLTVSDGAVLTLKPQLLDQELYFPDVSPASRIAYWEGAVTIEGTRTGVGYVELTGYAP
jgi:predicted secreted hydrolase